MVFIDTTAVNTILPAIRKSFTTGLTDIQWVVEIYVLFLVPSRHFLLRRGFSRAARAALMLRQISITKTA